MNPGNVLLKHNLKRTSCREGILEVIMNSRSALSEHEIREKLHSNYDRTTFYRSFKTLEENNIIHRIVVDNQIVKYAIDSNVNQKRDHIHFYCFDCDNVVCLEDTYVKIPKIPDGFVIKGTEVVIKGRCQKCTEKK